MTVEVRLSRPQEWTATSDLYRTWGKAAEQVPEYRCLAAEIASYSGGMGMLDACVLAQWGGSGVPKIELRGRPSDPTADPVLIDLPLSERGAVACVLDLHRGRLQHLTSGRIWYGVEMRRRPRVDAEAMSMPPFTAEAQPDKAGVVAPTSPGAGRPHASALLVRGPERVTEQASDTVFEKASVSASPTDAVLAVPPAPGPVAGETGFEQWDTRLIRWMALYFHNAKPADRLEKFKPFFSEWARVLEPYAGRTRGKTKDGKSLISSVQARLRGRMARLAGQPIGSDCSVP